jgi:hypothetical protein
LLLRHCDFRLHGFSLAFRTISASDRAFILSLLTNSS